MILGPRFAIVILSLSFSLLPPGSLRAEVSAVDLTKIPVPSGAKRIFADSHSAIYSIDAPADAMTEVCAKLLSGQGWEPYGFAGLTRYYKRGAIRLLATIQPEAGRAGRSMITFSSEALSADIPLPPDTEEVQYNDSAKRLGFLSALKPEVWWNFTAKPWLRPDGSPKWKSPRSRISNMSSFSEVRRTR